MEEFPVLWVIKIAILSADGEMGQERTVNIGGTMSELNK